ncbi:type II toxin-antitoxin system Phd/YefM family antitoxin [Streptococcus suis]|uniref:type II toxin-antitoxin system Phd/YefM family antitoxin n=1 Tax=Streptococcus suis TaxID=1307 RepID=UPI000F635234|nr:type II toxin-antitoxin system Phd/YefM family antitoxin [Streptococcus suis]MCH1637054.1 type II toxin-antitoxin system Phd/YefM family antitoxin [Streptococcus suis]MCH1647879.1 type II toxin-antitoxin system Phd/YefM family antitoxin [Streptococcus suis]NQI76314.1 type II toxin-antitoxin system Phd/YefM family antitoxin [Streptococcus suis]NQI78270.1 type II toxin-antitoxin system Phd/YefM family antitoxin [Streptococcus suis]NQI82178.1 type II toxin-antitoxin system Phd/YefM family anti
MQINIENLVSISEANQNFSKVARMVDTNGTAVILKNNTPKYVLLDYQSLIKEEQATPTVVEQSTLDEVATSVLSRHLDAFKELAK